MQVGVIGAGIVGLCCAEVLSRRGFDVVVFDKAVIPAPRAASNDARRLLRHAYPEQSGYGRMVDPALTAWQQLWLELGENHFHQTGTLMLVREATDFGARAQLMLDHIGHRYDLLAPAQVVERFPFLIADGIDRGIYTPSGGVLKADRILTALTKLLVARDVRLEPGCEASSVDLDEGIIQLESGENIRVDRVLLTAGAWTPELIGATSVVRSQRQVQIHVAPPESLSEAWASAPAIVDFGGSLDAYAVPPAGDQTLTLAAESIGTSAYVDASRIPLANEGVYLLDRFKLQLLALDDYRIERTKICFYALTDDGCWHVQIRRRGVALTGCNGHMFKFGAMAGEMLAAWAEGRIDDQALNAWSQGAH